LTTPDHLTPKVSSLRNLREFISVIDFLAISKHRGTHLAAAENCSWLFLYLHQLFYEITAIAYPSECGMPGKKAQPIQTRVNRDLAALSKAKFGRELPRNDAKNNKVLTLHGFNADIPRGP
jgi:hypothetical protein